MFAIGQGKKSIRISPIKINNVAPSICHISFVGGFIFLISSYKPSMNISPQQINNGHTDSNISGRYITLTIKAIKKAIKIPTPPKVGTGRELHRSLRICATQPIRMLSLRNNGMPIVLITKAIIKIIIICKVNVGSTLFNRHRYGISCRELMSAWMRADSPSAAF